MLTRDGIRNLLERMALFLKRPSPSREIRYFFSVSGCLCLEADWSFTVIFTAVTYILFGAGAFGDGDVLFTLKSPPWVEHISGCTYYLLAHSILCFMRS
jgi:hypothetical protein